MGWTGLEYSSCEVNNVTPSWLPKDLRPGNSCLMRSPSAPVTNLSK